jgi:hypothetical protein
MPLPQHNLTSTIVRMIVIVFATAFFNPQPSIGQASGEGSQPAIPFGTANDVSGVVELVGNPFTARWSDGALAYARNVWDMEVWADRLYLGSGNSNNYGPAQNAGPVDVWYYDGATGEFAYDTTLEEEQIDQFVVLEGGLFIPGHDAKPGSTAGLIHVLSGSQWTTLSAIPRAVHVYDLMEFNGLLFASLGIDLPFDGDVVASSADQGQTWALHRLQIGSNSSLPIGRAWDLFQVGGDLLVSTTPQYEFQGQYDSNGNLVQGQYVQLSHPVFRLADQAAMRFEEVPADFFAGVPDLSQTWTQDRIERAVRFGENTVYIGAETVTDHNWTSFGLFSMSNDYTARHLPLQNDAKPWDLIVDGNVLYVLAASPAPSGNTIVGVLTTCDLTNWREVLHFEASTFARSFALYQQDFYFGLGTEAEPISADAGNILRVSSANFTPGCG